MFKFKKKNKDKENTPDMGMDEFDDNLDPEEEPSIPEVPSLPESQLQKRLKKILLWGVVPSMLIAMMGAGYYLFLANKDKTPVYPKIAMEHVDLSDPILRFTFDHMPEVYKNLVIFNMELKILDEEIQRIESIADQFPAQKKIAIREQRGWKRAKSQLSRTFSKLVKKLKDIYVLYQVNEALGETQISQSKTELSTTALTALDPIREKTQLIKERRPKKPKGFVKQTIHSLKKLFQ